MSAELNCYICNETIHTTKEDYFTYTRNYIPFHLHERCVSKWQEPKHNTVEIKEDPLTIEENFS